MIHCCLQAIDAQKSQGGHLFPVRRFQQCKSPFKSIFKRSKAVIAFVSTCFTVTSKHATNYLRAIRLY